MAQRVLTLQDEDHLWQALLSHHAALREETRLSPEVEHHLADLQELEELVFLLAQLLIFYGLL